MLILRLCVVSAVLSSPAAWAKIDGLYGSDCLQVEGLSAVKDFLFEQGHFEMVQTVFADTTCGEAVYDFAFSGPYVHRSEVSGLDLTFANIRLTALDSRIVQAFNASQLCGLSNWELGVPVEVSGRECGGQQIPAQGSQVFDIIRELDDGIQMGLAEEPRGLPAPQRPSRFDDIVYRAK